MSNPLVDFYRCSERLVDLIPPKELRPQPGYFAFGSGVTCYGQSAFYTAATLNGGALPDLSEHTGNDESRLRVPFDASTIIDNLRFERYPTNAYAGMSRFLSSEGIRRIYYYLRPMMGDSLRHELQRQYFRGWKGLTFPQWPVDTSVECLLERLLGLSMRTKNLDRIPFIWFWPDGASGSAIMTHDVETTVGLERVRDLMDVDDAHGIKSSFQIVPEERYSVPGDLLDAIRERQCEVNVHGLNHDGNLFSDRKQFLRQSKLINRYVQEFGAQGFRSACMYRNVDWNEDLQILYDMSVPNVAHLEPQRGGCCTVFPYFAGKILELPLTTIQDYSLFHILGDYSIKLWKEQIKLIMERQGMISFIIHPDYIFAERALLVYKELLTYVSLLGREKGVWIARPGDVNQWWRERSEMKLVQKDGKWGIEGRGRERARIAYARIEGDEIVYTVGRSYEEPL